MSTEAAEAFRTQGYYHAQQLIPPAVVEGVYQGLNRLVTQQLERLSIEATPGATDAAVFSNLKALFDADVKAYIATLTLSAKLFEVHSMLLHESVANLMRELGIEFPVFQTSPVLHIMSHDLEIPGGYSGLGTHQDWPALQGPLDTITIWVPLLDVPEDNFPLEFIPGSHTRGLYPGETKDIYEVDSSAYNSEDFTSVDAHRGDALLFSTFLLHRSGLEGNGVRVAISFRYENAAEPTFIERSYPFAQKRAVQREFITADFPSEEQVARLYGAGES